MTYPRRRLALIFTVSLALLAACGTSTNALRSADTIGPIGVAPVQPASGAEGVIDPNATADPNAAPTEAATPSAPVQAPGVAMARDDTGQVFAVTESVPTQSAAPIEITDPRILFVGDSVSLGMAIGSPDPLDAYVQSMGWKIALDGRVGRFTDEGIRVLQKRSSEIHQVLVLMLGNNYGGDQDQFRQQVAQILQLAAGAKRIIMFTVPLYATKQREVNDVLLRAAATDPRLTVIDWETASRSFKGALSGDGIHPTTYGAMILDQMLAVTLGPAPGGPADATLPTVGDRSTPGTPSWVKTNKGEGNPSIGDPNVTIPPYKPPTSKTTTTAARPAGTTSKTSSTTTTTTTTTTTAKGSGSTTTTSGGGTSATTTTTKASSGSTTTTTADSPTTTTRAAATTSKAAATTSSP